jgi:hypothetical protein
MDDGRQKERCDSGKRMLTTRHRNHFVNSKEGRALYGEDE